MVDDLSNTKKSIDEITDAFDVMTQSMKDAGKFQDGLLYNLTQLTNTGTKFGKTWMGIARMISGTPLWRIQNKFKGVVDFIKVMQLAERERLETEVEAAKVYHDQVKAMEKITKLNNTLSKIKAGTASEEEKASVFQSGQFSYMKTIMSTNAAINLMQLRAQKLQKDHAKYMSKQDKKKLKFFRQSLLAGEEDIMIKEHAKRLSRQQQKDVAKILLLEEKISEEGLNRVTSKEGKEIRKLSKGLKEDSNISFARKDSSGAPIRESSTMSKIDKVLVQKLTLMDKFQRFKFMWTQRWEKLKSLPGKAIKGIKNIPWKGVKTFIMSGLKAIGMFILYVTVFMMAFYALKKIGVIDLIIDLVMVIVDTIIYFFTALWVFIESIITFFGAFVDFIKALFGDGDIKETGLALLYSLGDMLLAFLDFSLGWILEFGLGLWDAVSAWFLDIFMDGEATWTAFIWGVVKFVLLAVGVYFTAVILTMIGLPVIMAGALALAIVVAIASAFGMFAGGGVSPGGMAIVGEQGPELVKLPAGTRVHSNKESRGLTSGQTNNININVSGRVGASDNEIRDIANKIGRQMNMELNRTTSSGVRGD